MKTWVIIFFRNLDNDYFHASGSVEFTEDDFRYNRIEYKYMKVNKKGEKVWEHLHKSSSIDRIHNRSLEPPRPYQYTGNII